MASPMPAPVAVRGQRAAQASGDRSRSDSVHVPVNLVDGLDRSLFILSAHLLVAGQALQASGDRDDAVVRGGSGW